MASNFVVLGLQVDQERMLLSTLGLQDKEKMILAMIHRQDYLVYLLALLQPGMSAGNILQRVLRAHRWNNCAVFEQRRLSRSFRWE